MILPEDEKKMVSKVQKVIKQKGDNQPVTRPTLTTTPPPVLEPFLPSHGFLVLCSILVCSLLGSKFLD